MIPIAVTIAGSDSGGGAGIQADLKTFSALGVYGASAITAITAQNTLGVQGVHGIPTNFVGQQIDSIYSDLKVSATKVGMLANQEIIEEVSDKFRKFDCQNIVLDPVMVSATGDQLIENAAVEVLVKTLLPIADLITPNLQEAARILETKVADNESETTMQAKVLKQLGPKAVLLKGGHNTGTESNDLLLDENGVHWFKSPRISTSNTHGTGCTLSSAIAANLAKGSSLKEAVSLAKTYVTNAIRNSNQLTVGSGVGPVHHFYGIWKN